MLLRGLRERGCAPAEEEQGAAERAAMQQVSEKADGFDAKDIESLIDRALHVALRRQLAAGGADGSSGGAAAAAPQKAAAGGGVRVAAADLEAALEGFVPAAFRGVGRSARGGGAGAGAGGPEGWQDVGGLREAKAALIEALELPIK
jgi:SpoVK/Ycf46/Vps4 family AAA+-type ATPase